MSKTEKHVCYAKTMLKIEQSSRAIKSEQSRSDCTDCSLNWFFPIVLSHTRSTRPDPHIPTFHPPTPLPNLQPQIMCNLPEKNKGTKNL